MTEQFSVLMSLYDQERPEYLRQSLDSVYAQTLPPDEVVMVLDGPIGPELTAVLGDYPQLRLVPLPANVGLGAALNEGLRHCAHDLVARMDTDDICLPQRFERQIPYMAAHPEVDALSAWIHEFEGTPDNIVHTKRLPVQHDDIVRMARRRDPMHHPCTVYRKHKVLAAGGYSGFPEDYYLWVHMIITGCRFHNLPEVLLLFRYSQQMIGRRGGWQMCRNESRLMLHMWRVGYVSLPRALSNMVIRGTVRMMPAAWRKVFYDKVLRR